MLFNLCTAYLVSVLAVYGHVVRRVSVTPGGAAQQEHNVLGNSPSGQPPPPPAETMSPRNNIVRRASASAPAGQGDEQHARFGPGNVGNEEHVSIVRRIGQHQLTEDSLGSAGTAAGNNNSHEFVARQIVNADGVGEQACNVDKCVFCFGDVNKCWSCESGYSPNAANGEGTACQAAYVKTSTNSDTCPTNYVSIYDTSDCDAACAALGVGAGVVSQTHDWGSGDEHTHAGGCGDHSGNRCLMNTAPAGSSGPSAGSSKICKLQADCSGMNCAADVCPDGKGRRQVGDNCCSCSTTGEAQQQAAGTGDPHLTNTRGQSFDVYKTGQMEFLRVPFQSSTKGANFTVLATIEPSSSASSTTPKKCTRELYIASLNFGGAWLMGHGLVVSRAGEKMKATLQDVPLKPSPEQTISEKVKFHMLSDHRFQVVIGSTLIDVKHVPHPVHHLDIHVKSLQSLGCRIGGLLGDDDHKDVSTCAPGSPMLMDMATESQGSRASASMLP